VVDRSVGPQGGNRRHLVVNHDDRIDGGRTVMVWSGPCGVAVESLRGSPGVDAKVRADIVIVIVRLVDHDGLDKSPADGGRRGIRRR
jgi:hypothetical protein